MSNLAAIFGAGPGARGRVTMAYTSTYFVGGAIGAAVAATAYSQRGWPGVCAAGGVLAVVAFLIGVREASRKTDADEPIHAGQTAAAR
ncbi:hypothetical protein [Luteipulveratus halotolerans]|uniref:hypothetical protein n=1 Tax=Luteipulveratus halotolerans TaxID=1631356 RepID=UPI0018D05B0C|nr:hypothetical protein [Luteipulveratus halotolerans]